MPGEELPQRSRLNHVPPWWIADDSLFFITVNCVPRGLDQLCRPETATAVVSAARFYHEHQKWSCRLLLLMPDHLHAIVAFPFNVGLKTTLIRWKGYLAKSHGIRWQQDFFDHRLRDHWQLIEKTSYILNNPVRRGLCNRPEDWPHVFRPER